MFPARLVAFTTGLLSLGAETLWVRTFSFAQEGTPQSFSVVLALYLIGIALGAMIAGRLCKSRTNLAEIAIVSIVSASVFVALAPALLAAATHAMRYSLLFRQSIVPVIGSLGFVVADEKWPRLVLIVSLPIMALLMISTAAL